MVGLTEIRQGKSTPVKVVTPLDESTPYELRELLLDSIAKEDGALFCIIGVRVRAIWGGGLIMGDAVGGVIDVD